MIGMLSGFNPGVQLAQERAILAMQGAQPAAAPAGAAGAAGLQGGDASAQAMAGAAAVAPPSTGKIVLSSVLRGAMSGASMMFGLNSFGAKIPFVSQVMTKILHFIPFVSKAFPMGTVAALGMGAAVGAIFGLVGGLGKARKAAAEYANAQSAAQSELPSPVGDPLVVSGRRRRSRKARRNPVMGKLHGARGVVAPGVDGTRYHIKSGDTLWALSRRFGCSIDDIVKANPKITNPNLIYAGDHIEIPAKD